MIRLSVDASLLPSEAHVADMPLHVVEPMSHDEVCYIKALKTYETEHARCLSLVEEIGGQFRHTSKAEYASQLPS